MVAPAKRVRILTGGLILAAVLMFPQTTFATKGREAVGMCIDSTASGARCAWSVNDKGEIDICNKNGCVHLPGRGQGLQGDKDAAEADPEHSRRGDRDDCRGHVHGHAARLHGIARRHSCGQARCSERAGGQGAGGEGAQGGRGEDRGGEGAGGEGLRRASSRHEEVGGREARPARASPRAHRASRAAPGAATTGRGRAPGCARRGRGSARRPSRSTTRRARRRRSARPAPG